jgi:hypothetical protein
MHNHQINKYKEGFAEIAFCLICSGEGLELFCDCPGNNSVTTDRRRMAMLLALSEDAETWPMDILDKLILIEKVKGKEKLYDEMRKLTKLT